MAAPSIGLLCPLLHAVVLLCTALTKELAMKPRILDIVEDMEATYAHLVNTWFTHYHYETFITHLVHNVFDKDPSQRTISLNATYIVLFKNHRAMSWVSHLDNQVYLSGNGILAAAFCDAIVMCTVSYVVIDFNQLMPKKFCICNTLFPNEDIPEVATYWPTYKEWENTKDQAEIPVPSFNSTPSPWQESVTTTATAMMMTKISPRTMASRIAGWTPRHNGTTTTSKSNSGADLTAWSIATFAGMLTPNVSCTIIHCGWVTGTWPSLSST